MEVSGEEKGARVRRDSGVPFAVVLRKSWRRSLARACDLGTHELCPDRRIRRSRAASHAGERSSQASRARERRAACEHNRLPLSSLLASKH